MKYKLEAYQKNFPNFIYGSLINIKIYQARMKQGPVEQFKKKK
jgi:hypothetical protein